MMTKQEEKDIKIVLEYLWLDEQKHYQENSCEGHIYSVLKRLAKRIGYSVVQ